MARLDPHSFYDSDQPRVRRLDLALDVDFARQILSGTAVLDLGAEAAGPLDLDTRGLTIHAVATGSGAAVPFTLGPEESILGRRLRLRRGRHDHHQLRYPHAPRAAD